MSTPPTRRNFLKEVIQPQVPLGLPCYDFTPVMNHKVVSALPKVKLPTSFARKMRTCVIWQFIRFVAINIKMIIVVGKSH